MQQSDSKQERATRTTKRHLEQWAASQAGDTPMSCQGSLKRNIEVTYASGGGCRCLREGAAAGKTLSTVNCCAVQPACEWLV